MERNNKYRVTLVVEYLGWDDSHLGLSTVRPFLPGRYELGWIAVQRWWNNQINVNQTTKPKYAP